MAIESYNFVQGIVDRLLPVSGGINVANSKCHNSYFSLRTNKLVLGYSIFQNCINVSIGLIINSTLLNQIMNFLEQKKYCTVSGFVSKG